MNFLTFFLKILKKLSICILDNKFFKYTNKGVKFETIRRTEKENDRVLQLHFKQNVWQQNEKRTTENGYVFYTFRIRNSNVRKI